jgi:hypothetical protein
MSKRIMAGGGDNEISATQITRISVENRLGSEISVYWTIREGALKLYVQRKGEPSGLTLPDDKEVKEYGA